ncbi:MMPL family transporter [Streptomyces sp. HB2AG]|uniref:MMPL family transporter n=1 Tax=Streptomyces sp. HB2AG TaxID=2983400 RepID=UPI0022AAB594|nr:MMPL family transporter [Streptomyces sp. HB2AG]MCZ2524935.1 MMPL family transporter [Streptomyces sp. HB2AG]
MTSTQRRSRWLLPVLLLVVWLGVGGAFGPYAGKLGEVSTNDSAAFLPQSAESTKVNELRTGFETSRTVPAIVVWVSEEGRVTDEQRAAAARALEKAAQVDGATGKASPPVPSEDGRALQGVVPLADDLGDGLEPALEGIRAAADEVPGTTADLGGPAATQADLSSAFAGIDGILLGVALAVVLVILLAVYRSVLLPFAVILGSVFALALACAIVYFLADRDVLRVDGQVQGILFILVIGAATDYALLLVARYREELVAQSDRFAAMGRALRQSAGAITASAATVALGLLTLLLSDLTNNRALGPVGAIGIVCAVVSALTFLPAVLLLLGRAAYWPAKPQTDDGGGRGGALWGRVAQTVQRRPRRIWTVSALLLAVLAAFSPTLSSKGVPLDEIFINDAPSVAAQQKLAEHFPGGSGNPAVIIADAGSAEAVVRAAESVDGVDSASPVTESGAPVGEPKVVDGRVAVNAVLEDPADSDGAKQTVVDLREAVHAVDGADALVGGYTAQQYDTQVTTARDRAVVIPVVLVVILAILVLLLRSLVAPLLLVATVALNFAATLGVSALVFEHLLGLSGTDSSVPLYGFVFLVALGVDYNIFLMTRVREESQVLGTRKGVLKGLVATGGVITSAGVVLAATFAALTVIPLAFMLQIAFIVAFGVLMDTLLVRSLLVPALILDIGPKVWWPGRLARQDPGDASGTGGASGAGDASGAGGAEGVAASPRP